MTGGNPLFLWSDEETATLRHLWEVEGLSATQCAQQTGRSRNAVIGRAHRLGMVNPRGLEHKRAAACLPVKRKHRIRRTNSPSHFVRETNELVEKPHDLLAPPVAFMDLRDSHCRWPIDGEDGKTWYCGVTKCEGLSYCPAHARLAYTRAPAVISDAERARRQQAARNRFKAMVRA